LFRLTYAFSYQMILIWSIVGFSTNSVMLTCALGFNFIRVSPPNLYYDDPILQRGNAPVNR
ncbi:MAG: hypothetical protein ACOYI6_11770, partial [Christensenellales bacterium]